ncbi:hypothetical protein H0E87_002685 [Populus deltoides]|uniref:Uncharacterized protein n=1 Tax=Populus deltoides TaxID=3696 RepID=A0A8T2ZW82_POPDE|nr:hypothetical protein H0E87_002685 [Populus deltoides]
MWFGCDGVGFTTVVEERKGLLGYEEASVAEKPAVVVDGGKRWFEVTGLLIDAAQRWSVMVSGEIEGEFVSDTVGGGEKRKTGDQW